MKKLLYLFILCMPVLAFAQMPKQPDAVWISIADSLYALSPSVTQTEVKPGWKIADIAETKSKAKRYLWGAHARQMADSAQPLFVLKVTNGTLHDFIILRLKQKKQYRLFAKAEYMECEPTFIDLTTFNIKLLPDERYQISPLQPFKPGEYVIIDTTAKPVNEFGDRQVYGFTITK